MNFDFLDDVVLLEKATDFYRQGRVEEAFRFLNRAYKLNPSLEARLLYAKLYYEIDAFSHALQKCFEIKLSGPIKDDMLYEINTILFKIYFSQEKMYLADVAFAEIKRLEEMESFVYREEYEFEGIDIFLDYYRERYQPFYVIDKQEEATKQTLRQAYHFYMGGFTNDAIKTLRRDIESTEDESQYNMLVMCCISAKKYKLAEEYSIKMLESPPMRLQGILNLISIAVFRRNKAEIKKWVDMLEDQKIEDEEDLSKVTATLMLVADHAQVEKYAKKYLDILPYDYNMLYHYACALACQKKYDEAKSIYVKIRGIYHDTARSKYFIKYCGPKMRVFYGISVPYNFYDELRNMFKDITYEEDLKNLLLQKDGIELIYAALFIDDVKADIFLYFLASMAVYPEIAKLIDRYLTNIHGDKTFKEYLARGVLISEIPFNFRFITEEGYGKFFYDGTIRITGNRHIDMVYFELIITLIFSVPADLKECKVYAEFLKTFYETTENKDALVIRNSKAMAAAVYHTVQYRSTKHLKQTADIFEVSVAAIKRCLKKLEERE